MYNIQEKVNKMYRIFLLNIHKSDFRNINIFVIIIIIFVEYKTITIINYKYN